MYAEVMEAYIGYICIQSLYICANITEVDKSYKDDRGIQR